MLYYLAFLGFIDKLKGVPLWKLFVLANLSKLVNVVQLSVFFDSPLYVLIGTRFFFGMINRLSSEMFLLPLIGRISKYLPEGFESTGVVVIISCLNFSSTTS